jgi:hypothetical protein
MAARAFDFLALCILAAVTAWGLWRLVGWVLEVPGEALALGAAGIVILALVRVFDRFEARAEGCRRRHP